MRTMFALALLLSACGATPAATPFVPGPDIVVGVTLAPAGGATPISLPTLGPTSLAPTSTTAPVATSRPTASPVPTATRPPAATPNSTSMASSNTRVYAHTFALLRSHRVATLVVRRLFHVNGSVASGNPGYRDPSLYQWLDRLQSFHAHVRITRTTASAIRRWHGSLGSEIVQLPRGLGRFDAAHRYLPTLPTAASNIAW